MRRYVFLLEIIRTLCFHSALAFHLKFHQIAINNPDLGVENTFEVTIDGGKCLTGENFDIITS